MSSGIGYSRLSLKKKILGTCLCLLLYRLLSYVPLPFIERTAVLDTNQTSALGLFNLMTGGNMFQMSIGSLGVAPYITASIFVQMLAVLIPSVYSLQKTGFVGHQKLHRLTVLVSCFTSLPNTLFLLNQYKTWGVLTSDAWYVPVIQGGLLILTGMFFSYMGMYIEEHFFGSGLSLILITGIVSSLPQEIGSAYTALNEGKTVVGQILSDTMFVILIGALALFVCWMLSCGMNLPLIGSQKITDDEYLLDIQNVLPLRMLSTSVMPVIFASSILGLPAVLFASEDPNSWICMFNMNRWFTADPWWASCGVLVYFLLIFMFGRYAQMVELNEVEIAESLRKSGFVIQGVGPGRETEVYLKVCMNKLNKMGSAGLCLVAVVPVVISRMFNVPSISLLGTSLILIIHVMSDLLRSYQVERRGQAYVKLLSVFSAHRKGEAFCLLEKARLRD